MAIELPKYKNLSYQDVLRDLQDYARARADFGSWQDFLESSAGQTLLELMAGMGTYLSFHSLAARRESYLNTCRLLTSGVGISDFLGYPVNRVLAPKITMTINVISTIFWEKETPLATLNGLNLVLLDSQTLVTGPNTVDVVLGNWTAFEQIIDNTQDFNNVRIIDEGIDNTENERVRLFINGVSFFLTRNPEDLLETSTLRPIEVVNMSTDVNLVTDTIATSEVRITGEAVMFNPLNGAVLPVPLVVGNTYFVVAVAPGFIRVAVTFADATAVVPIYIDLTSLTGTGMTEIVPVHLGITDESLKVLFRTLTDGGILLFGDDFFGKKVSNGDDVVLEYIKTAGLLDQTTVLVTEVEPLFDGTVTSIDGLDRGSNGDTLDKMKLIAPAYHSTKRRMVTRDDHIAVFLGFEGDLISANARRTTPIDSPTCCEVDMCYLWPALGDTTQRTATDVEKAAMLGYLENFKMVGETINILDPTRVLLNLKLTVVIFENINVGGLVSQMKQTIVSFTQKLGTVFHIGEVVEQLALLDGIRRIYLHFPQYDRVQAFTEYIFFDEAFFDTNLVLTTTDPVITVPVTVGGYTPP